MAIKITPCTIVAMLITDYYWYFTRWEGLGRQAVWEVRTREAWQANGQGPSIGQIVVRAQLKSTTFGKYVAWLRFRGCNQQIVLSESKSYSEAKIVALFEKYKDASEDFILSEGIEEFCIDLQLKPDEFKVLGKMADWRQMICTFVSGKPFIPVLAWKFEAEQMCRFSRPEFVNGKPTFKSCAAGSSAAGVFRHYILFWNLQSCRLPSA